jgi:hypothetical protein
MGGRALKNTQTRRYSKAEFDLISKELIYILRDNFARVDIPLFYKNKQSFGDIDILVTGLYKINNMHNYIQEKFNPTEIFHNGNCWSFDYKEIQVDIITSAWEHYDSYLMYLSYNDLGNLIGRIAHGLGFKYGQEGLWYEHYFKNQNIGNILISKDYPKIYNFLGLDYSKWERGFDELEDIFKFISESPFFNWKKYQFSELNKINRDRNKKRASYIVFLEWVDKNVADSNHEFNFLEDKTGYLYKANEIFPEANIFNEVKRLEYLHCRKLYIQSKFNGGDVMKKYGFVNKELGDKMTGFKSYVKDLVGPYDEYILNTPITEIYADFDNFLKEGVIAQKAD